MRLEVSKLAERDLAKIGQYIAKDKPIAAMKWLERMQAEFRVIQANALLFPVVRTPRSTFRKCTVRPYLIFFRTQGDVVRIERVLHGMRDIPRLLT